MSGHTLAYVDIVFDGPPSHKAGRFVEVENEHGASIKFGEWVRRDDGLWALRIPETAAELERAKSDIAELVEALAKARPALELLATEEARRNRLCAKRGIAAKTTASDRLQVADAALAKHARAETS